MNGDFLRGYDRSSREYNAREPVTRCEHGIDTYQRDCLICEYEREVEEDKAAAVPLAILGSVGALLLWLFLSSPSGVVA